MCLKLIGNVDIRKKAEALKFKDAVTLQLTYIKNPIKSIFNIILKTYPANDFVSELA